MEVDAPLYAFLTACEPCELPLVPAGVRSFAHGPVLGFAFEWNVLFVLTEAAFPSHPIQSGYSWVAIARGTR